MCCKPFLCRVHFASAGVDGTNTIATNDIANTGIKKDLANGNASCANAGDDNREVFHFLACDLQ